MRVRWLGFLGTARVTLKLDLDFGDQVVPDSVGLAYPVVLSDFPAPEILGYSRESVIAEKFHAMVRLGPLTSRMNDFFDLWLLAREYDFEGRILAEAISMTFATRHTAVPAHPAIFDTEFSTYPGKAEQWRTFLRRNRIEGAPSNFADVTAYVSGFLLPVAIALSQRHSFERRWNAAGPWR